MATLPETVIADINQPDPLATPSQAVAPWNSTGPLSHLLNAFDVDSLGDGNLIAGVNQLAAMAIALANLARPESGIRTPEGRHLDIGCSMLATGPMVTSNILDEVFTPIRRCQDTLLSQLARLIKDDKIEENRGAARRWDLKNKSKPSAGEIALLNLFVDDSEIGPLFGTRFDQWIGVVTQAPSRGFDDLVLQPRVLITAPTAKLLEQQLAGAHLGEPLVVIGLDHVSDATKFGTMLPALMGGLIPAGPSGECVGGRLLVTDSRGLLREIATSADDKSAWLARLLWLVEDSNGPDLPPPTGDTDEVCLTNLASRYKAAVQKSFADRLNNHQSGPVIYEYNFAKLQNRWVEFLADMEKSLPGVTILARRLPATLVFGLRGLVIAGQIPKGFHYPNEGVEALARVLVQRMANHRSTLLFSANDARRLKDKRRILGKLAEDSLDTRSIYHPLHLEADLCRDLLEEMEVDKLVERNGRHWERVEGGNVSFSSGGHLQLEV